MNTDIKLNNFGNYYLEFVFEDEIYMSFNGFKDLVYREDAIMQAANYSVFFDIKSNCDTSFIIRSNFEDSIKAYLANFYDIESKEYNYWTSKIKSKELI